MKPLAISLLVLLAATIHASPAWEPNIIGNVRIEVPTDCKKNVQSTPGAGGGIQSMKKYSFRNRTLDLELVFLSFPPGTGGNLEGAAANMTAQLKAASGAGSLSPWKTTTVSGRPARHVATNQTARIRRD
jgi:hypothetical protein